MLDQFSKRAFLTAVVGQQVVPASTLDDLTTRKMMLHAVQFSCTVLAYLVINVCDVHAIENLIAEVVGHHSTEDVKRYVRPARRSEYGSLITGDFILHTVKFNTTSFRHINLNITEHH